MIKNIKPFAFIFLLAVSLTVPPCLVNAEEASKSATALEESWFVLSGYGFTHTGLGKTKAHVETVDFIVGHEKFLTGTFGPSFLEGRHSFVVEVPVHFVVDPWEDPIFAINFLARWTFKTNNEVKPYIFGGGGPVYTDADIPGLGSNINGNWQFGGGINFSSIMGRKMILEYRFHHISNLGTKDPNDPLNSSKILIGLKF